NLLVDRMLGFPRTDWNSLLQAEVHKKEEAAAAERQGWLERKQKGRPPFLPAAAYVGSFESAAYGPAKIAFEEGMLVWHWRKFRCPLFPIDGDTFLVEHEVLGGTELTFLRSPGQIDGFTVGTPLEAEFRRR
ncbi:MAG: DUF3471 domain-containing protein, partial [Gemmataceae bacterium]